jgi:hypothetical protein
MKLSIKSRKGSIDPKKISQLQLIVNSLKQNDKLPREVQNMIKSSEAAPWIKNTFNRLLKNKLQQL